MERPNKSCQPYSCPLTIAELRPQNEQILQTRFANSLLAIIYGPRILAVPVSPYCELAAVMLERAEISYLAECAHQEERPFPGSLVSGI